MDKYEAFRILELEPTSDKKKIKKAYAALAKKFHPEEQPEKWEKLHSAYEAALNYADHCGILKTEIPEERENFPEQGREEKKGALGTVCEDFSEDNELDHMFDHVSDMAEQIRKDKLSETLEQALTDLKMLGRKPKGRLKEWKAVLEKEEYEDAYRQKEFVLRLGQILSEKRINVHVCLYLKSRLGEIAGEDTDIPEEVFQYTAEQIEKACRNDMPDLVKEKQEERRQKYRKALLTIVKILLITYLAVRAIGFLTQLWPSVYSQYQQEQKRKEYEESMEKLEEFKEKADQLIKEAEETERQETER